MQERIEILNVPVDCVTMDSLLSDIEGYLQGSECKTIFAVNPEKVIRCQKDDVLHDILKQSEILIPDGIGVVLAGRFLFKKKLDRVAGADLMPRICEICQKQGNGIYLYGGKPEVNTRVVQVLKERFSGINIVGNSHGYVDPKDNNKLIDNINASGADVIFIALGSPTQEKWARDNMDKLNVRIIQGVGGTFDVIAGNVKRAPLFFRKMHLEWFYRLMSQPSRLFRQTALPRFFINVLKAKFQS